MEAMAEKEAVKSVAKYFAHIATLPDGKPDPDQGHWQLLSTHFRSVAIAKEFVADFLGSRADAFLLCPLMLQKVDRSLGRYGGVNEDFVLVDEWGEYETDGSQEMVEGVGNALV